MTAFEEGLLEEVDGIVDELPNDLTTVQKYTLAIKLKRLTLEEKRLEAFNNAFVSHGTGPSALEAIVMELRNGISINR